MNNNQTSTCCCCGLPSNSPKGPVPQNKQIQKVIHILQLERLSLFSALLKVLDPTEKDFMIHHDHIYACIKDRPDRKLAQLLDYLYGDQHGRAQLLTWMEPHALQSIAWKVDDEMDDVKHVLSETINTILPKHLLQWDINLTVGKLMEECTPVLSEILKSTAQSN